MRSHTAPICSRQLPRRDARGFTLIEMLITLTVLIVVMGAVSAMIYLSSKSKTASSERIESAQGARTAIDLMTSDLRSAGYGADIDYATPQPQIAYIDSTQVLLNANLGPYPDPIPSSAAPRAYQPTGSPRPFPLNGTAWQPPIKYRTGAEIIRYTLDANNDGTVDTGDQVSAFGALANATQNPNDYVLLRQVYGDSTSNTAGNNGGTTQQIALVRKPGAGVPPMFTVYMKGSTTPWDWASGPVPATQLSNIERITVQVDAPSANMNSKGQYAETVLRSEINSMRNIPNFGGTQYTVTGFVYDDANGNNAKDGGEMGLASVNVRLGSYSTFTDASGNFYFRVYAGTYTLRHTVPPGYYVATSPDSFVINLTASTSRSFADRATPGGNVVLNVFEDTNNNRAFDTGEPGIVAIPATVTPGNVTGLTDGNGNARIFTSPGSWSLSVALPDSYVVNTTPYPITGTMINGDSAVVRIGLKKSLTGSISGKVFNDSNRDGVWQSGETGIQNCWVGVTSDAGATILGYANTNATGDYTVTVPINDPPHTAAYSVFITPPTGRFPTSTTSIGSLWLQTATALTGKNFGVGAYSVITLNASRVLSLAAADVIEKDWNGNQTSKNEGDTDLILGADAGATDNISVWYNQYNAATLFGANPTNTDGYTRLAPQSVLSIAVDTLDSDPTWKQRPDLVTGTKKAASGNLFVWLTQNTSGNYGILPTTYSAGLNYTTADLGDVQSVLTLDCAGGTMPDIIAGTKSVTANNGTIEIWQNSNAVTPTFSRVETYPNAGSIPGNRLGEVNAMILADLDNDGRKDLIVGTKTGASSGELVIFRNVSKVTGARFVCTADYALSSDIATSLAAMDLDGDGKLDIVVGTQRTASSGNLMVFHSQATTGVSWNFQNTRTIAADGVVLTLLVGDFGGSLRTDLAVGWRANTAGYVGGVQIYYTDLLGLPPFGSDPSGGTIGSMVPAVTSGNFNYGLQPVPAGPYLTDFACGVKNSATTGSLIVFIR